MTLPAAALRHTIQEFPPPTTVGPSLWFSTSQRGWYLPAYGERLRDQRLRDYDRHEDNALWQGAESGFLKWAANVPWEVTGKGYLMVDQGRGPERVDAVSYYTAMLQDAHFGAGWKYFVSRGGRDYLSQDFGWLCELIGHGDPSEPLSGAVAGIAVLDSLRCFSTGNPVYPIIYFSQITGKLHRLHFSRVARFVDMPDGDDRMYGHGLCALSRYISIAQQQIYMSRYIVQHLDDKPKPGVNIWSNLSEGGVQAALAKYMQDIGGDELGPLGKTINVYSIDPSAPAKMDSISFANAPEKFDYKTYMDIHVNALALALGVDKQELWELGGGNIGSGMQSEVLAQKARGKAKGDFLTTIERFVNIRVLPDADAVGATCDVSFKFKYKDDEEEKAQTEKDQALVQMAQGLKALGFPTSTIANMLADRSETFKELLTDQAGRVVGTVGDDSLQPEHTAADNTPQLSNEPTSPALPAPQASAQAEVKGLETPGQRAWFFANLDAGTLSTSVHGRQNARQIQGGGSRMSHAYAQQHFPKGTTIHFKPGKRNESHGESTFEVIGHTPIKTSFGTAYTPKLRQTSGSPLSTGRYGRANDIPMTTLENHVTIHEHAFGGKPELHITHPKGHQLPKGSKDYTATKAEFVANLSDLIRGGLADDMSRRRFGITMRAQLRRLGQMAYEDGLAAGGVSGEFGDDDTARVQGWLGEQSDYVTGFADTLYKEGLASDAIAQRAEVWANKSLELMYQEGLKSADANGAYEWQLGDAEQHCLTCQRLNGQVHRLKGWYAKGLLPKRDKLDCKGFNCTCSLKRTNKPAQGRY